MSDSLFLPLGEDHRTGSGAGLGIPESDRLYRTLGDVAAGFLWVVDAEGRFVYANRAWEEYTGSSFPELNGAGWEQFNHPEELDQVRERWGQAILEGRPFEMELRYRRHDGRYRWMLARVVPLRDETGEVKSWIGTSADIDDLKTTQEQLHRSQRELADFFENASVGLHWVGPDGTILRVNQAELDLLGYEREEYEGRNIVEFHADKPVIEDILQRLTRGEVLHDYPARLCCKDGSIKDVLIDSSVFFDDDRFIYTRCFTRDVTKQRRAEEAGARLAAIVTSSSDAVIGKTLQGVVTSWNAAAERIFGYTEAEMVGQSIFRLIPEALHGVDRTCWIVSPGANRWNSPTPSGSKGRAADLYLPERVTDPRRRKRTPGRRGVVHQARCYRAKASGGNATAESGAAAAGREGGPSGDLALGPGDQLAELGRRAEGSVRPRA